MIKGKQDALIRKTLKGSGKNEVWNSKDAKYYREHRTEIWNDPSTWINPDAAGWEGFATRVNRLASHYDESEKNLFVQDFAFLFGGMETIAGKVNPYDAALRSARGPSLPVFPKFLNEGNGGLGSNYIDNNGLEDNQSHHYVGIFFLSYYATPAAAIPLNYVRDTENPGDINLGEAAANHAFEFQTEGTYETLVEDILGLME